jgi:hypothetical protein
MIAWLLRSARFLLDSSLISSFQSSISALSGSFPSAPLVGLGGVGRTWSLDSVANRGARSSEYLKVFLRDSQVPKRIFNTVSDPLFIITFENVPRHFARGPFESCAPWPTSTSSDDDASASSTASASESCSAPSSGQPALSVCRGAADR